MFLAFLWSNIFKEVLKRKFKATRITCWKTKFRNFVLVYTPQYFSVRYTIFNYGLQHTPARCVFFTIVMQVEAKDLCQRWALRNHQECCGRLVQKTYFAAPHQVVQVLLSIVPDCCFTVFTTITLWNVPTTASIVPPFLCVLSAGANWRVPQRKSPSPCLCGTCDSACWFVRSGGVSSWGWTPASNTAVNWLFFPRPVSDHTGHFDVGLIFNATGTKWRRKLFELLPRSATD